MKVRNATAIGQRLACPKCGSMILVEPPENWTPDESSPTDDNFGDIDRVLAGNFDSPVATGWQAPRNAGTSDDSVEPILPGEQWTSSQTQQRRKWLLLTAGIVTILILMAAVVFAVLANRSRPDHQQAATHEPPANELTTTDPPDDSQTTDGSSEATSAIDADETETDTGSDQPPVPDPPGDNTDSDVDSVPDAASSSASEMDPPETETGNDSDSVVVPPPPGQDSDDSPDPDKDDLTSNPDDQNDPLAGAAFDDLLSESNITTDEVETNFDDLSDALENAGTSLFEFGQIAAVNERRRVGQKKYFIFQPDPLDESKYDGLNLPLEGIQYNDLSLLTVLADFFEITGVPVTMDADLLNDAGFKFGYRSIEFKVTDTTFSEVLQQLIDDLAADKPPGFELIYDGKSPAQITIADRDQRQPVHLPLPRIESEWDESENEIIELIKHLTGADAWGENSPGASLNIDGENLVVVNGSEIVSMVRKFVSAWNFAVSVNAGEQDRSTLDPMWVRSLAARDTAFQWSAKHETPILQFLASVQRSSGTNIIVNWDRLLEIGWNPNTEIPPALNEATVGDMLDELTHSMGLSYRVVNNNTFEITTMADVNERSQLEFFSCKEILGGKLDEEQLVDIVRNALRSTGQNLSAWRVVYEPSIKCFIVVGPQTLHRQINAILKRIEKL